MLWLLLEAVASLPWCDGLALPGMLFWLAAPPALGVLTADGAEAQLALEAWAFLCSQGLFF